MLCRETKRRKANPAIIVGFNATEIIEAVFSKVIEFSSPIGTPA
jgi:hypothetical protein